MAAPERKEKEPAKARVLRPTETLVTASATGLSTKSNVILANSPAGLFSVVTALVRIRLSTPSWSVSWSSTVLRPETLKLTRSFTL